MKIVENETYLDIEESMEILELSRQLFYTNARPRLKEYHFNAKKKGWYKKDEVLALKAGKSTRIPSFVITGLFKDWTEHARALGFHVDTKSGVVETVKLPEDAVHIFGLPAEEMVVKRSRISFADGLPICTWETYYPLHLVEDDLDEIKQDENFSIVRAIKERHGIVAGYARERYSARSATFREQEQMQLLTDEPILRLQRASYAKDHKTLMFYSDMALLGSWFTAEREYAITHWDE